MTMKYTLPSTAAVLLAVLSSSGCYHYHIGGSRVTPATEARSQTMVAYFWGLLQPDDITPDNCPVKVPLAEVTAHTNLGNILIGTVTLGIVSIQRIEWRCAKFPPSGGDVVQGPTKEKG
jgi:hypothetical protein